MSGTTKTYRCFYCNGPCKIEEEKEKKYMNCKKCGRKEATKLLIARLEARANG